MKTVFFKNIKISYSDKGSGKVIVFLHGLLGNKNVFDGIVIDLTSSFRILSIDLLGHGQTPCIGYIHTMEDQAEMIHWLMTKLKIFKATFVGHSMGGYIALAIAEIYPTLMEGLVLINSSAIEDSKERILTRNRGIKIAKTDYVNLVKLSVGNLFADNSREKFKLEIDTSKNEALQTSLQGYIAAQEGLKLRKNRVFLFQNNVYPISIVLGKKDPVLDYEITKRQFENSNLTLHTLDGGHMSIIENKWELKQILLTLFEKS